MSLKPRARVKTEWFDFAQREIGVTEKRGKANNPRIVEYHQSTNMGRSDDSVPWCSSFVNFCISSSGYTPTGSALARSWLKWGRRVSKPTLGCIVVIKSGSESWQGHVGFYAGAGKDDDYIQVLGGNQSNRVSIVEYHINKVLGYRMPKTMARSRVVIGNTLGTAGTAIVADDLTGGNVREIIKSVIDARDTLMIQIDEINKVASSNQSDNTMMWIAIALIALPQLFSIYDRVVKNRLHGI